MSEEFPVHATVTYEYTAPPESIFDAWLDVNQIGQFMFGPKVRDEEIVSLKADAHVGGSFSFIVRRKDDVIDHIGEYMEIARPTHLVFTWAVKQGLPDSSRIVIDIAPISSGCKLKLTQEMPANWAHFKNNAELAWTKMLTALDKIV